MSDKKQNPVRRWFADLYRRLISLRGPPEAIALGVAFGMAVSFFPLLGTHTAIVVGLCTLFRANVPAGFLFSSVGNPLTVPVFAVLEFEVGRLVLYPIYGRPPVPGLTDLTWDYLRENVAAVLLPLGVGVLIVLPVVGFASYFLAHRAVVRARRRGEA